MWRQAQAPAPREEALLSRRLRWLLACGAAGLAGAYFSYRVYRSDSLAALADLRRRLRQLLDSSSASLLLASECSHTVLRDLQAFLASDSDEVPQSLRQLCKLARSREVSEAAGALAASALRAFLSGPQACSPDGDAPSPRASPLERVMEALTTDKGMSLVSLAVGMACRSSVQAFFECNPAAAGAHGPALLQQLLDFGATPRGERLAAALVTVFVREGMQVYMGSLEGTNAWEDFLSALGRPERAAVVDRLTRVTVNELVLSFLKRQRKSFSGGDGKPRRQAPLLHAASRHPSSQSLHAEALADGPAGRELLRKGEEPGLPAVPEPAAGGSAAGAGCMALLAEAAVRPEVRGLLVAVTGTAAFEAVRAALLTAGEAILGSGASLARPQPLGRPAGQQASRHLGALLLFLLLPLLCFLLGRRAALA